MQHNYSGVRAANVVIGLWLFISAFAWPHSSAQLLNTLLVGLVIAVVAFIGMRAAQLRFVNTAVSIWLFISAFALPTLMIGTTWNNALVAIATFVLSLVGSYGTHHITPGATGRA